MNNNKIVFIPAEQIYQHPDNPRKDLGNLLELSESIKKQGIMQNLTVIQGHWDESRTWFEDGYTLLIGHRRFTAGKMAAVKEFPCRIISDMSQKDQVGIMLEENMQRNDLTIWEQANGFQMMLDLGDTEEQIAEKTGFSKTTIKRRLNIAKLDQKVLKEKEQDEGFQLTLKDLYELEKIPDIKLRDKILKESYDSSNLAARAQNAAAELKREKCKKEICDMLEKEGVKKAPEKAEHEIWSGKWKTIKEFALDKEVPKQLRLPEEKEQMYWLVYYRTLKVITKTPKEKRELSKQEIEQKEREKKKKQIKAILKESSARRKEFIQNIITGKIDRVKNENDVKDTIWQAMLVLGTGVYQSCINEFLAGKRWCECTEEEKQEAEEKAKGLSVLHQMLIILNASMNGEDETFNYQGYFSKTKGDALLKGYAVLEHYGWYFERDEEKAVLDGTCELYRKEE